MVVLKMKPKLLQKMTKFQIGGAPGHRSSEHLFSAKSMIQYNEMLGNVTVMGTYDIRKFFDKEVLRDAMDEVHNAGVDPKVYRIWYKLNMNTKIRVKTAVGDTEYGDAGELVGQGSGGAALVSALNLESAVNGMFEGSGDELSYGKIRFQPLLFQDDLAYMTSSRQTAEAGNVRITNVMQ